MKKIKFRIKFHKKRKFDKTTYTNFWWIERRDFFLFVFPYWTPLTGNRDKNLVTKEHVERLLNEEEEKQKVTYFTSSVKKDHSKGNLSLT